MFSGSDLGKYHGQNPQNIWSACLHQSCHYRLTAVINRNPLWTMNDIVSGFPPFIHTFQSGLCYECPSTVSISQLCEYVWLCSGVESVTRWPGVNRATIRHYLPRPQPKEWRDSARKVLPQLSTYIIAYCTHTLRRICFNYRVCKNQATID